MICVWYKWWFRPFRYSTARMWTGPGPARLAEKTQFVPLRECHFANQKIVTSVKKTLHGASQALIMKNLAISGTWRFALPGSNITTAIVDVDNACLWIATERLNADADVEVDIYKKGLPDDPYEMEDVSFPLVFLGPSIGPAGRCRFTAECRWRPLNSSRSLYHVQADSFRILPHKWLLSGALLEKSHLSSSRAEEISCR